jgi:hypothetical protein
MPVTVGGHVLKQMLLNRGRGAACQAAFLDQTLEERDQCLWRARRIEEGAGLIAGRVKGNDALPPGHRL